MLRAVLNKSWRQYPTKLQLYGHLPPIMKTIKVRRSRHAGHCWGSKAQLISDILLWTPSHGQAKVGRPARSYIQQVVADTGCNLEDLPGAMDGRDGWREIVREFRFAAQPDHMIMIMYGLVWVPLFGGISTLMGYLIPNPSLKNCHGAIKPIA